jgi:hypothetical protein
MMIEVIAAGDASDDDRLERPVGGLLTAAVT